MNNQKRNVTAVNISVVKYSFTVGALCQMPLERSSADDLSPPPTKRLPHGFFFSSFFCLLRPCTHKKSISKYTSKIPRSHPDSKPSRSCFWFISTLSLAFMFFCELFRFPNSSDRTSFQNYVKQTFKIQSYSPVGLTVLVN